MKKTIITIHQIEKEENMNCKHKWLMVTGAGVMALAGMALMMKSTKECPGVCDKVRKGIEESLRESKGARDKATAHVLNIFEHIKNRKI